MSARPALPYLFNFAVSYTGGGYKRLAEYSRVVDALGGAWFIAHPSCTGLAEQFPYNRYFFPVQPRYRRVLDDCGYLAGILRETGTPELYYAYGMPIYARVGRVNWFHLSNVLPLHTRDIPLDPFFRLKLQFLGRKIRRNHHNADVISAESQYSLGLIDPSQHEKLVLSVNGSDDELAWLAHPRQLPKEPLAVAIGTYTYKALGDSVRVFEMLREHEPDLRLEIFGEPREVATAVRRHPRTVLRGMVPRRTVMDSLRRSRYYISTTHIENSWNAASEGIFLAGESYLSDIGPHRELLRGLPCEPVAVPSVSRPLLHVRGATLTGVNLKSWEIVVREMIEHARTLLAHRRRGA